MDSGARAMLDRTAEGVKLCCATDGCCKASGNKDELKSWGCRVGMLMLGRSARENGVQRWDGMAGCGWSGPARG
jgi:hypothetical protein